MLLLPKFLLKHNILLLTRPSQFLFAQLIVWILELLDEATPSLRPLLVSPFENNGRFGIFDSRVTQRD